MPNGFSTNGGQTQNPYGPFETYGSSSGSAVSVAADLVTVSVGTETQGSIISPAEINSVVALKTSLGLVSRDYVIPLFPAQDVPGPMGRTVTDVAVLLNALTGVDENDPETAHAAKLADTDFTQFLNTKALQDVKVGIPVWNDQAFESYFANLGIDDLDAQTELRTSFESQIAEQQSVSEVLHKAGISVVEIPITALPERVDIIPALTHGYQVAINQFLADLGEEAPMDSLDAILTFNKQDIRNRAPYQQDHLEDSLGSKLLNEEFEQMVADNQQIAQEGINGILSQYDIDVIAHDFGQLYAPAGYPALTVPSGYEEDGTPRGIVFVGGYLSEPQLLAVGYAYEQGIQARVPPDLDATLQLIDTLDNK
jgi:amidase